MSHHFLQQIFESDEQAIKIIKVACSKDLLGSAFLHRVLKQYIQQITLNNAPQHSNVEQQTPDQLFRQLADQLEPENFLQLAATNEGVYSACQLFQFLTPKEKQRALNEVKKHLRDVLADDAGRHFIAYAMLNTDDTRFVSEFLGDAIRGTCGDFCQFVLLSGMEALKSGRFPFNGQLTRTLYADIADRNKKDPAKRFTEVYAYFEAPMREIYTAERVRALITTRMENFIFMQFLPKPDVIALMCEDFKGEPLFKQDSAHYALKQYLKRWGDTEICTLFIERFETMDVAVFTRRGCNVLMMLELLDKEAIRTFVRSRLQESAERWVQGVLKE